MVQTICDTVMVTTFIIVVGVVAIKIFDKII